MYKLDESRRPLLILTMTGSLTSTEFAHMKIDVERIVERAEPYAMVWDLTDAEIPSRDQVMDLLAWTRVLRARYTQVFDEARPRIPTFTAYCLSSSMVANLLRFFLQMVPSIRAQHIVCDSFEEAVAAAESALERFECERMPSRQVG